MGRDEIIEKKLGNKEYLEEIGKGIYQEKIIRETTSKLIEDKKGKDLEKLVDELFIGKEGITDVRNLRNLRNWARGTNFPNKEHKKVLQKTSEYQVATQEFIESSEMTYKYHIDKVELDEYSKKKILEAHCKGNKEGNIKVPNDAEENDFSLVMDNEGNFYVLKPRHLTGVATDIIEEGIIGNRIQAQKEADYEENIERVIRLTKSKDLQSMQLFKAILDVYEKIAVISDLGINNIFEKTFQLFSELMDGEIKFNEFSIELQKLLNIANQMLIVNNDKKEL